MARLRRRYRIIDHENKNTEEVGLAYVLSPAKNPADLAAMKTLAENVEPELAADLRRHIAKIESFPNRGLGTYGKVCLAHVTHPEVLPFAQQRLKEMEAAGEIPPHNERLSRAQVIEEPVIEQR